LLTLFGFLLHSFGHIRDNLSRADLGHDHGSEGRGIAANMQEAEMSAERACYSERRRENPGIRVASRRWNENRLDHRTLFLRHDRRLGSIVRQTPTPPVSMESSSGPTISMISAAVAGRQKSGSSNFSSGIA
jgi:hypothetical protein